jgi:ribosome-binding factor A
MQLCGQVLEALSAILSGLADETLQNLTVVKVEPAPNTGRLRVTVAGTIPADATDPTTRINVEKALGRATGLLRTEVARAICRKYAPELVYHLA